MKLLLIAQTFPYPLNTGSRNTIFHWIEAMSRAHDVRVLFIGDPAEARESIPELPDVKIETIAVNHVAALPARISRLVRAAAFGIPPTSLVGMTRSIRREVLRRVHPDRYDLVVLSENVVAGYAPVLSPVAPVVLLKHSVHAVDAKDTRRRNGMWHPRWILEESMVKRFEGKTCRAATVVCTVNSDDAADLANRYSLARPVEVVPIGVDFSRFPRREQDPGGQIIGFFGNMTWGANLDAVRWFAERVLPKVWQKLPRAEFRFMGPGSERAVLERNDPRIVRCGECDIPNAMKDATIGVVPVISGTGVRFKLLELLRMGIPTVTTSLGALGSGVIHGEHALVADDEGSFAEAVVLLFADPALRHKISRAGAELSVAHAWERFYPRIRDVVELAATGGVLAGTPVRGEVAESHRKQTIATQSTGCTLDASTARLESFSTRDDKPQETWVALLGRRDEPTDGVEDYCVFLGQALAQHGVELRRVRVPWADEGWARALRGLWQVAPGWRGRWVLLQYTGLSWSRRGFPFLVLAAASILRSAGARVAVVFHEPNRQGGLRWVNRVRGGFQDWVIHRLYHRTAKAIFTVPLDTVAWLPKGAGKAAFIPIGANIPERVIHRDAPTDADQEKTVIVFGVTGAPATDREVEEIATVIKETSKAIGKLRLVVVGRGAAEAREQLARSLEGVSVRLVVRGVLPAEEIAREFERADAQLFVRGAITPQRGSAIAGIACGLPIVAYQNGDITEPLREAGVEWSPWRDREALVRGLVRVLSDPARWMQLHDRNLNAQKNHFAWGRIAERYRTVLAQ